MHPTPSTSASPAPFHRLTSTARQAGGPSPSKRRKLATPAPVSNSSPSFSNRSGSTLDPQLDTERRACSSRVLSVWSALEDKYSRSLDEDDILDLRSGGLVKDRGVLRGRAGTWDIGFFKDPEEDQGQGSAPPEDDDNGDELGGWGSDPELDHQFNPVHIPPVRELDPKDAEDLRAFLAAEEVRKALHGVDDDLSEDTDELGDKCNEEYAETEDSIVEVEAGSALALSPTESDDELAGFDDTVGEGALLWEVGTELSNCSESLGAEGGPTPEPLHALPRRSQTPSQLCTPPLSRSSMKPPSNKDSRSSPQSFRRPPRSLPPPSPPQSRTYTSIPRRGPTASTSKDESMPSTPSYHSPPLSSPSHPPPAPSFPSHGLPWYSRHATTPVPTFPIAYPPLPNYTRESSIAPHPDAQMHIAQALQSLSYLAFGALPPPPPPSASPSVQPSHPHTPYAPSHSSPSPPPWSYPAPYYPHHTQPHASLPPPWFYPPYPYHYPPATYPHLAALSSAGTTIMTSGSGGEPPSSPPDFLSSPLSGKGKRKRVSFPQEVLRSESESGSNTDPGVEAEAEMSKGEGKGKGKASSITSDGRLRRHFQRSSTSIQGLKGKGKGKGCEDGPNTVTNTVSRLDSCTQSRDVSPRKRR